MGRQQDRRASRTKRIWSSFGVGSKGASQELLLQSSQFLVENRIVVWYNSRKPSGTSDLQDKLCFISSDRVSKFLGVSSVSDAELFEQVEAFFGSIAACLSRVWSCGG